MKPYKDLLEEDFILRKFSSDIDPIELMWHRDERDRIVRSEEKTNWMFQIDNELPKPIEGDVFIPKLVWHRTIKGNGDLVIKIKEL